MSTVGPCSGPKQGGFLYHSAGLGQSRWPDGQRPAFRVLRARRSV